MIAVGIIGVLAGIAIPRFVRFQLRAKSSEAAANLQAISKAQETCFAEFGSYVSVLTPVPATIPGDTGTPWSTGTNFDVLGWAPEGSIFFQYAVNADIDTEGAPSFFGHVKPALDHSSALPGILVGTTCVGSGVFNPSSGGQSALMVPRPCDAASRQNEF